MPLFIVRAEFHASVPFDSFFKPSSKNILVLKPNSLKAFFVSRHLRGWEILLVVKANHISRKTKSVRCDQDKSKAN